MNIQQLRAKIAALQDATMDEDKNFLTAYDEGKFDALSAVDALLDSLQEEPESIWHDAKEPPEMYRKYFARYSDGRINGSWERHDDGFIPWKDVIKEHNITHWCYVEDLLKL